MCARLCMAVRVWCVCVHLWCICECMVVPEEQCWQCASLHESWPCRNSMLYPHLKVSSGSRCHVVLTEDFGLTSNNHNKYLCGDINMCF